MVNYTCDNLTPRPRIVNNASAETMQRPMCYAATAPGTVSFAFISSSLRLFPDYK